MASVSLVVGCMTGPSAAQPPNGYPPLVLIHVQPRPGAQRFENWEFNVAAVIAFGVAVEYALQVLYSAHAGLCVCLMDPWQPQVWTRNVEDYPAESFSVPPQIVETAVTSTGLVGANRLKMVNRRLPEAVVRQRPVNRSPGLVSNEVRVLLGPKIRRGGLGWPIQPAATSRSASAEPTAPPSLSVVRFR